MDEDVAELLRARRYPRALERLVEIYGNRVLAMAITILRDRGRAEEVTQEIFLKVWQALPAYNGRAAPGTWLYTIARNTCLSVLRAESIRKSQPLDGSAEPGAAEHFSRDVEMEQLLLRLPEAQRDVITLYYLQERSVEEVARMLELPEGTVKSHLSRARRALGAMMKG